ASDITSGTLSDARLPSEMSAKEFATALGSIRIGGGTGDYRTYNFTTRSSQATWYFDRSIVQYLEFRRHENGSSFSSPFRFDFMDDSLTVAGGVTAGGTLAVGGAATFSNNVTVSGTITGNGSGLTNLNASNLSSGTVPSDRLPSTIGGNKTFSNNVTVGGNADISGTLAVGGAATFAASTFSGTVTLSGVAGARVFDIVNTGASQIWAMRTLNDQLQIGARASNGSWSNPPVFAIMRSGDTITRVEVPVAVSAGTAATSTSATLVAGQIHHRSSNTTVPSMNAGQWVAVQNTSTSSITLSQGSGVTLELGGTTTTGNRTLLPKGFAFIYFRANGIGVVHGSGVT